MLDGERENGFWKRSTMQLASLMKLKIQLLGLRHVSNSPKTSGIPLDDLGGAPKGDKRLPLYKEGKTHGQGMHSRALLIKHTCTSFIPTFLEPY
ncbi:hypothetical protein Hanom_Chr07g00605121 [Helianthus anomalus]